MHDHSNFLQRVYTEIDKQIDLSTNIVVVSVVTVVEQLFN